MHTPNGGWLGRLIRFAIDGTRAGDKRVCTAVAAVIVVVLVVVWVVVYAANGTSNVFPHLAYVPVIVASLVLGLRGGLATAVAGGVLMGPLMPLNVELGLAQPVENMVLRAFFFVLIAVTTGGFAGVARWRHQEVLGSRERLVDLLARHLRVAARLVAERDQQSGDHSDRVANNAVAIGRALGLAKKELRAYYWAGLLHDLGKLVVPESILRKPGPLTSEEFEVIKRHAEYGAGLLLETSDSFADIAAGVRSHHERWDGRGYPDGLAGEGIPLIGRVLAVVDVFEAITTHRPYREPLPRQEARRVIAEGAGTQFDPMIATVMLRLEQMGEIEVEAAEPALHPVGDFVALPPAQDRQPTLFN